MAFIHRFGSSLNTHVHFHVCVVDGVFEAMTADDTVQPPTLAGVHFHAASGLDEATVTQVHAAVRRRLLHAFVVRGHIEQWDAKEMLAYKHSGCSVDASVRIEADDRTGLERLLRYCARPPFSMQRLRKEGCALVYRCAKQHSEPVGGKQWARVWRSSPIETFRHRSHRTTRPIQAHQRPGGPCGERACQTWHHGARNGVFMTPPRCDTCADAGEFPIRRPCAL